LLSGRLVKLESQTPASAVRAEAALASARELLRRQSTASVKKPVPMSLLNQNRKPAAARVILRIARKQQFPYKTLPRHDAASGLLNLQTTLVRTMIRTTPGVKLPFQR
jgi:hypothetical protein